MLNAKPLLPVSVRHAPKRSRRKGSCMRLVIMVAILSCVGYAVFATRYIGSSKHRREVQDNLMKSHIERKTTVAGSSKVAQHDGRSLKSDVYSPHILVREHTSHHTKAATRKQEELARDVFGDDSSYDEVIARDRKRVSELDLSDAHRQQDHKRNDITSPTIRHFAHESGGDDLHVRSTHVSPVHPPMDQQNHHRYQQQQQQQQQPVYRSPEIHHHEHQTPSTTIATPTQTNQQQQQPSSHPQQPQHQHEQQQPQQQHEQQQPQQHHGSSTTVIAGPVEADRDAELRRESAVSSPSLAVGSHIEVDSHARDAALRTVVEPGGSPHPVHGQQEPTSERTTQVAPPITVTHLEPDSHQVQLGTVQEPVLTQAPHETDSSSHTVQHQAPEEHPTAPNTTASIPVVTPPTPTTTVPSHVPETVTAPVREPHADTAPQRNPMAKGFYALEAVDIDGRVRSLSEFAGKVTIVVNVASACGYTNENYKGLMKVYEKYHPHGLEILGFPCNQFGNQESGTEADIKNFCSTHYHVNFPMFSKVDVNGPHTHPVYQFLKRELPEWEGGGGGKGPGSELVWNFQKIFVDHEGRPVKRLYQAWDQNAVESETYRLLREARQAGSTTAQS